jgi:predicted transcriptional regulator
MGKLSENEEKIKKLTERVEEMVLKNHVEGKVIARKVERIVGILLAIAEESAALKRLDIVNKYGSNASTVNREISILKEEGLIRLKGGRKMGAYVLTEKGKAWVA